MEEKGKKRVLYVFISTIVVPVVTAILALITTNEFIEQVEYSLDNTSDTTTSITTTTTTTSTTYKDIIFDLSKEKLFIIGKDSLTIFEVKDYVNNRVESQERKEMFLLDSIERLNQMRFEDTIKLLTLELELLKSKQNDTLAVMQTILKRLNSDFGISVGIKREGDKIISSYSKDSKQIIYSRDTLINQIKKPIKRKLKK